MKKSGLFTICKAICLGLLLAFFPTPSISLAADQEVLIGLVPEINVFEQMKRYKALAGYVSEKTGIQVNLTMFSHYGDIVENFRLKKMDGAFFGTFTAVLAYEKLGVEPLVRPVGLDGISTYHGHIIARKDSGIRTVADMKGKTIAFIDKANACGYIFPLAYLKEHGVGNIDDYFRECYFTGSHDASIAAVLEGDVDVAVVKNSVYDGLVRKNPRLEAELVILTESAEFPSSGLFLKNSLDSTVKGRLKKTLLTMHLHPDSREILQNLRAKKFIETRVPEDYRAVYDLLEKAHIDLKSYNYTH